VTCGVCDSYIGADAFLLVASQSLVARALVPTSAAAGVLPGERGDDDAVARVDVDAEGAQVLVTAVPGCQCTHRITPGTAQPDASRMTSPPLNDLAHLRIDAHPDQRRTQQNVVADLYGAVT
jgi:hypothetical protein